MRKNASTAILYMARKVTKKTEVEGVLNLEIAPSSETEENKHSTAKRTPFGKASDSGMSSHEALTQTMRAMKEKVAEMADRFVADIETTHKLMQAAKDTHEAAMSERKEAWRRETEQYEYEQATKRIKEEDDYRRRKETDETDWKTQRTMREQALLEKENAMRAREAEVRELEKQTREFPSLLEKAVADAVTKKEADVKEAARIAAELVEKDREREEEIAKMRIQNLEDAQKRQAAHIVSLERQLQQAVERAQSLAVTIVEGGSKRLENESRSPQPNSAQRPNTN